MFNFKDSSNIIIENGVHRYSYPGILYRDKLKNGLSLVEVFEVEDYCSTFELINLKVDDIVTNLVGNIDLNTDDFIESFYDEIDEQIDSDIFPKKRKGKWLPVKKTVASNFKKNNRRQNGYSDKIFNLVQNTKVEDDEEYEEYEEDNWDDDDDYSYQGNYHIIRYVK